MRSADRNQKGASVVEFAIIAPLFISLLFAIVEFGLIIYTKGMMAHASREGGRFGVVYGIPRKTVSEIQAVVQNYLNQMGLTSTATVAVTYPDGNSDSGSRLRVDINYTYHYFVLPSNINQFLGKMSDLNLTATAEMRME
ncbi:MAG: pilus assembly protein [Deltaproteobacteria bacterium]|nr:pilus assembly protein [Deltaproteobacteria bacterium]MBI4796569.1 pilus assembly protein [Deltaproteobacteria bacterium]